MTKRCSRTGNRVTILCAGAVQTLDQPDEEGNLYMTGNGLQINLDKRIFNRWVT